MNQVFLERLDHRLKERFGQVDLISGIEHVMKS